MIHVYISYNQTEDSKVKTHGLVVIMFAVALSFAPQLFNASAAAPSPGGTERSGYSAQLISPTAGQVLYPGQKVKVEWRATLPNIDLTALRNGISSVAGWRQHFSDGITPLLDPRTQILLLDCSEHAY